VDKCRAALDVLDQQRDNAPAEVSKRRPKP